MVGVAAAKVRGGLDAEIVVEADEDRLAALGLTPADLALALRQENINQPGGTLRDFNAIYLVRTMHEFEDLEQIRRTVVRETAKREDPRRGRGAGLPRPPRPRRDLAARGP